jgi:hypothetical protein
MLRSKKLSHNQGAGQAVASPPRLFLTAHILVKAMSVRFGRFQWPKYVNGRDRTKAPVDHGSALDIVFALGFIVLVLTCIVIEGFYFLQLPI